MKLLESPAFGRNIEPILEVLGPILPQKGLVLETASGPGQHLVAFADRFPFLHWQGSDYRPEAVYSIGVRGEKSNSQNIVEPLQIDLSNKAWHGFFSSKVFPAAILNINMSHISPWSCTKNLIAGAADLLDEEALLFFYGPWWLNGVPKAPSNIEFDQSLKDRNTEWGIRELDRLESALSGVFRVEAVMDMPANNISIVCRRSF